MYESHIYMTSAIDSYRLGTRWLYESMFVILLIVLACPSKLALLKSKTRSMYMYLDNPVTCV